ncbi:TIR-like protein FxsC [Pseudosporangium ferrugineum]|uniref:FxsC-like protein n=1 Tax=Pseudosporangium ferrugineum TaxID=439699 RepID=A0A2T0S7B0_9ACTN|nr:TIR-like protein FxsC [Pseudosporangium ferrugineum]PRY29302.1 FxsC-like protein [Pseudosporangium ferrugineum]
MLYFFLSYARGGDDVYVQEFFNDLCDEVRALEGLDPATEVGFLDNRNIQPGDTWPDTLVDALSRCQAFLALCSPAYFLSEPCGREWAIFQERIRQHQLRTGNTGSTLIPLRWLPSRTMPPAAQIIQYVPEPRHEIDNRHQEPHRERGIRQLLRIRRNRDDYLEFVTTVAELVVEATWRDPMPTAAERLPFDGVPSAFHTAMHVDAVPPAVNGGPPPVIEPTSLLPSSDKVYFVVSAPTAEEAADERVGREDRQYYGPTARSWSPYKPGTHEPLADYAARIAAGRSLRAQITEVGELEACIDQARRDNQIVVLLVDPWSTKMDANHEILVRYDRREDHPAAVMLPWSTDDLETSQKTPELNAAVRQTFPRNMRRPHTTTFRQSVLTTESFRSDLQAVLEESRNRVIANGTLQRPLPGPRGSRPILEGP